MTTASDHYDSKYFKWQSIRGKFGGWANQTKFNKYIKKTDIVLDFGCGGGYLLKEINCKKRIGIEINSNAAKIAIKNGVEIYSDKSKIKNNSVNVIISNNALEHTQNPLMELKELYKKLKKNGKIIFIVPCESISYDYEPKDINHHLYSWSPMAIGNLFVEAGFKVIESKPYIHKWPPYYKIIANIFGRNIFDIVCRIYGHIERSWFQVRVIATKK